MKLFTTVAFVLATMAAAFGYKHIKNPYNGDCKVKPIVVEHTQVHNHRQPATTNHKGASGNYGVEASNSNRYVGGSHHGTNNNYGDNGNSGSYGTNNAGGSKHWSASSSSGHRESGHQGSSGRYPSSTSSQSGGYGHQQTTSNYNFWDREFANEVLSRHNFYRVQHATPTVSLDEKMSRIAQDWATQLASGATDGHSPEAIEGEYGESIHVVALPPTGNQVVSRWYQERINYNFRQPTLVKTPPFRANRHFTAMVWYGTRKIGVGKATSRDGRTFVVVNYWPAGNIFDVLENNVLPPRS